jgi:hypothetical protein
LKTQLEVRTRELAETRKALAEALRSRPYRGWRERKPTRRGRALVATNAVNALRSGSASNSSSRTNQAPEPTWLLKRSCVPPDGYTLLALVATNAVNASLYDKLSFNLNRDIAPVAGLPHRTNSTDQAATAFVKYLASAPAAAHWEAEESPQEGTNAGCW